MSATEQEESAKVQGGVLEGLIAKLEAATGPSRLLDCLIWAVLDGRAVERLDNGLLVARANTALGKDVRLGLFYPGSRGEGFERIFDVVRYTASLDDAVALVERVLPGWHITVGNHDSYLSDRYGPNATISKKMQDGINYDPDTAAHATAPTMALALCLALLRALASLPPSGHGTDKGGE